MVVKGEITSFVKLEVFDSKKRKFFLPKREAYLFLWNDTKDVIIDLEGEKYTLRKDEILFMTDISFISFLSEGTIHLMQWNAEFYGMEEMKNCVLIDKLMFHSTEFFPCIYLNSENQDTVRLLWEMFQNEIKLKENNYPEFRQILLKRLLVLSSKVYKKQNEIFLSTSSQSIAIRDFTYLVEKHYKELHLVSEYAAIMNKSAKTLTNIFAMHYKKSPSQVIQNRILREAKKMLTDSSKSIKEITFELGFDDMPSFSRFFKNKQGQSPREYRVQKMI